MRGNHGIFEASDGKLLLASGDCRLRNTGRLWDAEADGDAVAVLSGHPREVTGLGFGRRSDGKLLLASAGVHDEIVCLWDVEPVLRVLGSRRSVAGSERVFRNYYSVSASAQPEWDPEPGKPCLASGAQAAIIPLRNNREYLGVAISPDGTRMAVSNGDTHRISVYTGSLPDASASCHGGWSLQVRDGIRRLRPRAGAVQ